MTDKNRIMITSSIKGMEDKQFDIDSGGALFVAIGPDGQPQSLVLTPQQWDALYEGLGQDACRSYFESGSQVQKQVLQNVQQLHPTHATERTARSSS